MPRMSQDVTSVVEFKGQKIKFSYCLYPDKSNKYLIMTGNPLFFETFNGISEFLWDRGNDTIHTVSKLGNAAESTTLTFKGEAEELFKLLSQEIIRQNAFED